MTERHGGTDMKAHYPDKAYGFGVIEAEPLLASHVIL